MDCIITVTACAAKSCPSIATTDSRKLRTPYSESHHHGFHLECRKNYLESNNMQMTSKLQNTRPLWSTSLTCVRRL